MTKDIKQEPLKTISVKTETVLQSIVCDVVSFSVLGVLFWFNYNFIGGSYFVNFLIILLCIIRLMASTKSDKLKVFWRVSDEKISKILKILEEDERH